jgi:hypothetical protein
MNALRNYVACAMVDSQTLAWQGANLISVKIGHSLLLLQQHLDSSAREVLITQQLREKGLEVH